MNWQQINRLYVLAKLNVHLFLFHDMDQLQNQELFQMIVTANQQAKLSGNQDLLSGYLVEDKLRDINQKLLNNVLINHTPILKE